MMFDIAPYFGVDIFLPILEICDPNTKMSVQISAILRSKNWLSMRAELVRVSDCNYGRTGACQPAVAFNALLCPWGFTRKAGRDHPISPGGGPATISIEPFWY